MNMKNKIIAGIVGVVVAISGYFLYANITSDPSVGVDLPEVPALFETSLAAPLSAAATSMTLTSNTVRGGDALELYNCFTIDEGSSQAEFVCGTVSGTSVTGMLRGISPSDGMTEVTALKFAHRRGASVKVTDFPIIQLLRAQNNGDETFENVLSYAAGVVPSSADNLADVGYVLSVVTGGAVSFDQLIVAGDAGETVATGTIVYFDADDQEWKKADNDISTTSINVPLGIAQGPGTDTNPITGGILIMGRDTTQIGMTLGDDIYLSGTAGATTSTETNVLLGRAESATVLYFNPKILYESKDNTWTGINTFSGDVVFTGSITGAHSQQIVTFTSSGTWTKDAGLKYVVVEVQGAGGKGSSGAGGAGGGYAKKLILASALGATETVTVGTASLGSGNTSFGTLALGGNGGNAVNDTVGSGGVASSGDININGQSGQASYTSVGGGGGGSSVLGFGGRFTPAYSSVAATGGESASGYGGGGAGNADASDGSPNASGDGGAGTAGIVIVTEYY